MDDDANDSNHNGGGKHMKHSPDINEELSNTNVSPPASATVTSATATAIIEPNQQSKNTTKKRKLITDAQQPTDDADIDDVSDSVSASVNQSKKPTLLDDIRENKKKEKCLTDMICNAMSK